MYELVRVSADHEAAILEFEVVNRTVKVSPLLRYNNYAERREMTMDSIRCAPPPAMTTSRPNEYCRKQGSSPMDRPRSEVDQESGTHST